MDAQVGAGSPRPVGNGDDQLSLRWQSGAKVGLQAWNVHMPVSSRRSLLFQPDGRADLHLLTVQGVDGAAEAICEDGQALAVRRRVDQEAAAAACDPLA